MEYTDLVKKRNKNVIIYLITFFSGMIPLIIGAILIEESNLMVLGIILVVLSVLIFVLSTVWLIVNATKLNKLINAEKEKMEINKIIFKTGERTFKTQTGKTVEFDSEFFTIDGAVQKYDDWNFYASLYILKGEFISGISFIMPSKNIIETIDLTGDLLDELLKNEIKIINEEDLDYYKNNIILCHKQIQTRYAFNPTNVLPMEFNKNKDDKKKFHKRTTKSVIGGIVVFAIFLAINILLIWLTDSESGIEFSNTIGLEIIFKIAFSIILVVLIFYKNSEHKLYSKISIGLYLALYLAGIFYLPGKINIIIDLLFFLVFIVVGIIETNAVRKRIDDENKRKNTITIRYFGLALFIAFGLLTNMMYFTYVDDYKPWLYSLYVMLVLLVGTIIAIAVYNHKHSELSKKQKVLNFVIYIFAAIFVLYTLPAVYIANLNYALDTSEPLINNYEILEKENGTDSDMDTFTIIIEGKEVEISVSDAEYHKFEVGDYIEVYLYEGAFKMSYYIHFEE